MKFINENEMKTCNGIYRIKNIINGWVYIGQTFSGFQKRCWQHRWKLRMGVHDNKPLQADWNKYGEQYFEFEVVEVIDDERLLNEAEIGRIRAARRSGKCYNISDGGGGKRGVPMSEDAKAVVGAKNREHMTGRKASTETKKKMSATRKGKHRSPEVMEALRQSRIGSHHSDAAKSKMSRARIAASMDGRGNVALNEDIVIRIKQMLMSGCTKSEIANSLGVAYHNVKSVDYGVAWNHVFVEGWEDFKSKQHSI